MKKLIVVAALGLSAITMPSLADNVTADVSVTINLTPLCQMTTPGALQFDYTSFGSAATASGGAFTIKCTTSLPYKVGFDSTASPATTKSVAAGAGNFQLAYSLGLSGTVAGNGTGNTAIPLSVTGSMAANQSGTCATAAGCSTSESHAVYVVY